MSIRNTAVLIALFALPLGSPVTAQPSQVSSAPNGIAASSAAVPAPTRIHFDMTEAPPELSGALAAQLAARRDSGPRPYQVPLPVGTTAEQRPDSAPDSRTATVTPPASATQDTAVAAPGTFTLFRDVSLGATIKTATSGLTGEPTIVNAGPVVFATGNWWAALSTDGGQNFSYINPATQFPASFGGFCCDQIAVYDPSRNIFIWYLQYIASGPAGAGQNLFRVAVAHPADAVNGNWWYYDFTSASNTEYDYPDLCLSNDHLWVTTNRGVYGSSSVNNAFIFKFPLDPLSTAAGLGFNILDLGGAGLTNLSLKCAHGARETAYFGSHNTTSQVRIFRWAENSGTIFFDNVNLSAAWGSATHVCPTPDGRDWCGFSDGRMLTGWMSRNMIGFMWNSSAVGTFAVPYVDAVRVLESTRAYVDRPYIWNPTQAFQYPAAAPNARGDVGIVVHASSSTLYPSFYVGIDDDYSRDAGFGPPGWDVRFVRQGTQGPTTNRWGDYFSVRPFTPNGLAWIASGTTMQGCGGVGCKETRYEVFGRERDTPSVVLSGSCTLDVDGNGTRDALTDGLLLLRALFGLTGTSVTTGAIGASATRTNWSAIRGYLNGNCGTTFLP